MKLQKNLQTRTFALPLALATLALVMTAPASASSIPAWTVPASADITADLTGTPANIADVFTTSTYETVTALGVYDLSAVAPPYNTYSFYETIGLYNSAGNLIASVQDPASLTQPGVFSLDGYLWVSTDITLTPGTYTLDIFTNGSNPGAGESTTFPTTGWATVTSSEYATDAIGLADPSGDNSSTSNAFYGANLLTNSAPSPTPEPESLLLLGSGLIGLAGFVRLRRRKN